MRRILSRALVALAIAALGFAAGITWAKGRQPTQHEIAYAHVLGNGTLDSTNSKNVIAIAGGNGLFCFKLAFTPKNASATIADDPTAPNQSLPFIEVGLPPTPLFTCRAIPKPDAVVATFNEHVGGGGQSGGGHAFYVYWTN